MTLWILDTDHLSLFERGNASIARKLAALPISSIAITVITVEEVFKGRFQQLRRARGQQQILGQYQIMMRTLELVQSLQCLPFDAAAYTQYQKLVDLKLRIGTQDMKIGAIALARQAILATCNRRHFEKIPGLQIEDWTIEP